MALTKEYPAPAGFDLEPLCYGVFYGILNILMTDSHIYYR